MSPVRRDEARTPDLPTCIRLVAAAEVLPLRHAVLRAGLPIESARFDGDGDPATRHYAASAGAAFVGCAGFMPSSWDGGPAWQLRGMATDPAWRGRGVGRSLLLFAEADLIAADPRRTLWCHARVEASAFYLKQGWSVVSGVYEIAGVGPHVRMTKSLGI